jgi:hypothetical protein
MTAHLADPGTMKISLSAQRYCNNLTTSSSSNKNFEVKLKQNGYLPVVCQQIASELNTFLLVLLPETLPTNEENH